jgi:hypothetical protein
MVILEGRLMFAAQAGFDSTRLLSVPSFLFVVSYLACCSWYGTFVVPNAINKWANENNIKITHKKPLGFFERMAFAPSNIQIVYRVVIQDRKDQTYSGMIKLGHYWWPCLSAEHCPLEVRWDGAKNCPDWPEV